MKRDGNVALKSATQKEPPHPGITLEEWAFLQADVKEDLSRERAETLAKILAKSEELQALQLQLERMADDSGHDRQAPGWSRDVVLEHGAVDRLLTEQWDFLAEILTPEEWMEADYQPLIQICTARRSRGEEPSERLAEVALRLRAALALADEH